MSWSKTAPNEAGYYWRRVDGYPAQPVEVNNGRIYEFGIEGPSDIVCECSYIEWQPIKEPT